MTRIVSFADGFTSASVPNVNGGDQESYILDNNNTGTILTLNPSAYKTVFYSFELTREGTVTYAQSGSMTLSYNGSWELGFGAFQGDNIIQDSILNAQDVVISVSGNDIVFECGDQPGHVESTIKLYAVRIIA